MFKPKVRDRKDKLEQRKRRTGMLLSLLLMFVLILLSSSFVLRFIYNGASNVEVTQEGVAQVFRAAIGDTAYTPDEYPSFEDEELFEDYTNSYNFYDNTPTTDTTNPEGNILYTYDELMQNTTGVDPNVTPNEVVDGQVQNTDTPVIQLQ